MYAALVQVLVFLLLAPAASAQTWTDGTPVEKGLANFDQTFSYAVDSTAEPTENQDVTACDKPLVTLTDTTASVALYDCDNATDPRSRCTLLTSTPQDLPAPVQFARGFVRPRVTDIGAGTGSLDVKCENVFVKTFVADNWTVTYGSGGGGGGGDAGAFDACRSGEQGFGFNSETGRWASTCGNYNWSSHAGGQPSASYFVNCTGDGTGNYASDGTAATTDALSCLQDGETRLIGALHRIGTALEYTADGGTVYLPNFSGQDSGIYVHDGCGTLESGTRADCVVPYEPKAAADLAHYEARGATHMITSIQVIRGITVRGEGIPYVEGAQSNTPELHGTWIVDDRGAHSSSAAPAGVTLDGPNSNLTPLTFGISVGFTAGGQTNYCSGVTTSDSIDCVEENNSTGFKSRGGSILGAYSQFEGNQVNTSGFANVCVADGFGQCVGGSNDGVSCKTDTPCTAGGGACTLSEGLTTGTCQGDRSLRCWATDDTRENGGCDFSGGTVGVDLGPCQGFAEAWQYEMDTNGVDAAAIALVSNCEDDASSASDCSTSQGNQGWIVQAKRFQGVSPTYGSCGPANAANVSIATGKYWSNDAPEDYGDMNYSWPFIWDTWYQNHAVAQTNDLTLVDLQTFDLKGAGYERVGIMPANWYSRDANSDGISDAQDCISGGAEEYTPATSSDEATCDSNIPIALMAGIDGKFTDGMIYNGSPATQSSIDGSSMGFWHRLERNSFTLNRRGTTSDPTRWIFRDNKWIGNRSSASIIKAFGTGLIVERDIFQGNYAATSLMFLGGNPTYFNVLRGVQVQENRFAAGGLRIEGGGNIIIEDGLFIGNSGNAIRVIPASGRTVSNISVANNSFFVDNMTGGSSDPYTPIFVDPPSATEHIAGFTAMNNQFTGYGPAGATSPCLVWWDTAGDEADLMSFTLIGNSVKSPEPAPRVFCMGDAGVGGRESAEDADTPPGYVPVMMGNTVNGVGDPAVPYPVTVAANAGDCTAASTAPQIAPGSAVAITDDTASGACTDAGADGVLDGGGTAYSVCTCANNNGTTSWVGL